MRDRAVVALEEVLRADLPVGRDLGVGPVEEAERADVDACSGDPLRDVPQDVGEGGCFRIGVDEEKRSPRLEPEGNEPELLALDSALAGRARRRDEPPVEAVRPGVVRALERRPVSGALAHERSPVAADVEERPQHAVLVPDEHHRHVAEVRRSERSRFGDLVRVADVLPEPPEDALPLDPETAGSVYQLHGTVLVEASAVIR